MAQKRNEKKNKIDEMLFGPDSIVLVLTALLLHLTGAVPILKPLWKHFWPLQMNTFSHDLVLTDEKQTAATWFCSVWYQAAVALLKQGARGWGRTWSLCFFLFRVTQSLHPIWPGLGATAWRCLWEDSPQNRPAPLGTQWD